ncbi:MAG: MBL fold metallo-hydrolase [Clostridia bacterium]|nr:MBL fold metallo-hydrolase [Clostridia bacterium]
MHIVNLASGSKGNSTLVEFKNSLLLIDVGLTEKKLKERLAEVGKNLSEVLFVCITHEHIDHIRGLEVLAKKYDMEFFVHKKLAESEQFKRIEFKEGKLHTFETEKFNAGDFEITPFDVSHDAVAPVGFTVNVVSSKSKVGFVTDLGIVTDTVKKALVGSKIVFIESNYDRDMLLGGKYPYLTKMRIDGDHGHLSNEQSLMLASYLYDGGTKCFVLSHISENNNTYEKAYLNFASFFEGKGLTLDSDVFLRLSFQNKHGNNFTLNEEE